MKYDFIDTCFGTHHPQFGYDADNTLWLSGSGPVAGWVNTKCGTRPATRRRRSAGSRSCSTPTATASSTNSPSRASRRQGKDTRFNPGSGPYAVMPHPTDGSVWYTSGVFGGTAGLPALRSEDQAQRVLCGAEGSHRPARRRHRRRRRAVGLRLGRPPDRLRPAQVQGPLSGPNATGDHCPEGLTLHKYPGPGFDDVPNSSAEASYYTWVDHHNTVGLGPNVPISTANLQDGFVGFKDGQMVLMRVPYPMGFYAKGLDGRIDDPNAGWKGRGLWSASGDRTPWLNELGKGARPLAVQIQVRPDPLAK